MNVRVNEIYAGRRKGRSPAVPAFLKYRFCLRKCLSCGILLSGVTAFCDCFLTDLKKSKVNALQNGGF
jgi:hypothetical protein